MSEGVPLATPVFVDKDKSLKESPIRKTRSSINSPGHAHELTFTTYKKARVLTNLGVAEGFLHALDQARHRCAFDFWAYVVMPDHCHVLTRPRLEIYNMSVILSAIKNPASKAAFEACPELEGTMTVPRAGRTPERRLWLPGGGYDRNIAKPATAWKRIRYTHANPFVRGLTMSEADWKWSSVRAYDGGDAPIPVDLCDWESA